MTGMLAKCGAAVLYDPIDRADGNIVKRHNDHSQGTGDHLSCYQVAHVRNNRLMSASETKTAVAQNQNANATFPDAAHHEDSHLKVLINKSR